MSISSKKYSLNQQQLKAVNTIDGPLLVLAGPGTGKTELLTERIINILDKTDTPPENIICLTFTNGAAINMYSRLFGSIGNAANLVRIRTFHSLAAEIINEFSDNFWNGAQMRVISEVLQADIINSELNKLHLNSPLAIQFSGKFTMTGDVIQAIKLAKEAGLTPDKLRSIIDANLAYIDLIETSMVEALNQRLSPKLVDKIANVIEHLPPQNVEKFASPMQSIDHVIKISFNDALLECQESGKYTALSRWKSRWVSNVGKKTGMHKERSRNLWWLELADIYKAYRKRLHQDGFYDYADMIVEVISVLEQNERIRSQIQEKCHYLLIDEFQDSNPAQFRLAALLCANPSQDQMPNFMAVGDDDQTIFKFNGAEHKNILTLERMYPKLQKIVLSNNYRSHQDILKSAEKVIDIAESRISHIDRQLNKNLISEVNRLPSARLEHLSFTTAQDEYSYIAKLVSKFHDRNQNIAILARSHKSLEKFLPHIVALNVDVKYERLNDLRKSPICKQLLLLSQLTHSIKSGKIEDTDQAISEMLLWPELNVSPELLWKLASYRGISWLQRLKISKDLNLTKLHDWLFELAKIDSIEPLSVTFEYILGLRNLKGYSGPLGSKRSIDKMKSNLEITSAIQAIRHLLNEFSNDTNMYFEDLYKFLKSIMEGSIPLASERITGHSEAKVKLMTVHKSKGLEFDTVFILDAIQNEWSPRRVNRQPPANLPLQQAGDNMDDYTRLMYVAITRAKQTVIACSYKYNELGEEIINSSLLDNALKKRHIKIKTNESAIAQIQSLMWPLPKLTTEKNHLRGLLENYQMSVTHLINFLDVSRGGPRYFYEQNLLRVPQIKSESLAYGTAIHAALETAQKLINKNQQSSKLVIDSFVFKLQQQSLTRDNFSKLKIQGEQLLSVLLKNNKLHLRHGSTAEFKLQNVRINEKVIIRGNIDLIQPLTSKECLIIDYKTGKPLSSFSLSNKQIALKAWKHKLQLIFYSLLVRNSATKFSKLNLKSAMIYLEQIDPFAKMLSYTATEEDLEYLRKLINIVWAKINNLEFKDTSMYTPDYNGVQSFISDLMG